MVALPLTSAHPTDSGDAAILAGAVPKTAHRAVDTSMSTLNVPALPDPARANPEPANLARRAKPATKSGSPTVVAQLPAAPTEPFGVVGVTWDSGSSSAGLTVQIKTLRKGTWSPWQDLDIDTDGPSTGPSVRAGTSPTWVGNADGIGVRLLSTTGTSPVGARVALIDGDTGLAEPTTDNGGEVQLSPAAALAGVTAAPAIVTRAQWGVNTSSQSSCTSPNSSRTLKGVVIHHTVGSNLYTRAEAPGIVRSIQLYHTKSRGWCDLGYNFLVDNYGTVYEGRRGGVTLQVRGAHAGNWDVNTYTTGISMMGNFDIAPVPTAMKNAVAKLTAWRLSSFGLGAYGKSTYGTAKLPRISGHRDVYNVGIRPATATACPGRYGYEWLVMLRKQVAALIAGAPVVTPPPPVVTPPPGTTTPPPVINTPPPVINTPPPVVTPPVVTTPVVTPPATSRLAGVNRYATAAAISKGSFRRAKTVFLASGEVFADALSAGPASAGKSAPILLTSRDRLPAETAAELKRLKPATVYLMGGMTAVSDAVATEAATYAGNVIRVAGANRYATAVAATKLFWSSAKVVYVASGDDFPDALSGGALAAHNKAPLLLTAAGNLPQASLDEVSQLAPTKVVILGGTAAVSNAVVTQLRAARPTASVTRIQGTDRYATSAAVAKKGWATAQKVYFAAGSNFPDAVAGVPAAAKKGAPLLLTRPDCMPGPVYDGMRALKPATKVLLGGSDVLPTGVLSHRCVG